MDSFDAGYRNAAAFRVVFVCTANLARSPLAEALFRRHVGGLPVEVRSRGTTDVGVASGLLPEAVKAGDSVGVDLRRHRAQALAQGELLDADLVVGFEPFHVSAAVVVGEAESSRAFTLHELAGLLDGVDLPTATGLERARLALGTAHAKRALDNRLAVPSLADPAGRSQRAYLKLAREIDALTASLADQLFVAGARSRRRPRTLRRDRR